MSSLGHVPLRQEPAFQTAGTASKSACSATYFSSTFIQVETVALNALKMGFVEKEPEGSYFKGWQERFLVRGPPELASGTPLELLFVLCLFGSVGFEDETAQLCLTRIH